MNKTKQTFSMDPELYAKVLHIKKVTDKNRSQIMVEASTKNIEREFQKCRKDRPDIEFVS